MMHRTCKIMIVSAVLIAGLLGSNVSSAATIVGSKHDFSVSAQTGTSHFAGLFGTMGSDGFLVYINEVCVFCHTPHGAADPATTGTSWLWNRVNSPRAGDTYKMYTSLTASTGNPTGPTGVSMMCMSCHDGVTSIAVGTLKVGPGGADPSTVQIDTAQMSAPGAIGQVFNSGSAFGLGANIGEGVPSRGANQVIDLSNDHPVSFEWTYTKSDLWPSPTRTELRLFGVSGRRIECATCHRVHDPSIPPFLAMDNTQSAMCLACHNK